MKDPVVASDDLLHLRSATSLMEWFDRSLRSPMTNKTIDRHVVPNYTLLSVIGEQREQQLNPTSSPGQKSQVNPVYYTGMHSSLQKFRTKANAVALAYD